MKTIGLTGVAGFIGSNLLESFLVDGFSVVGVDDFSTGYAKNIEDVRIKVGEDAWSRFKFVEGSIEDFHVCESLCEIVDVVSHQAALGSVSRSMVDPMASTRVNVTGFVNMLSAAREKGVERFVYASSSSVYGDHEGLPKVEGLSGRPLSPYAVTKAVNESYADVFSRYGWVEPVGLRYFNVFGPRQDPHGAYSAVIPRWINQLIRGDVVELYGDGETSRDFCYIDNVILANKLALFGPKERVSGRVFNISGGERITLNQLYSSITQSLESRFGREVLSHLEHKDFRVGDVRHSLADLTLSASALDYYPEVSFSKGMEKTIQWFLDTV